MSFLRNVVFLNNVKFWTIVAGAAGVLSLCLALYIFVLDQWMRPKALTVGLVSISNLLNENVKTDGKILRVLFGDDVINKFAIVQIRIQNTGGQDISDKDFERPLTITLNRVRKIYLPQVTYSDPPQLKPVLTSDTRSITIAPLVINTRDSFLIEAGVDIESEFGLADITIDGRILGVRTIEPEDQRRFELSMPYRQAKILFFILYITTCCSIFFFLYIMLLRKYMSRTEKGLIETQRQTEDAIHQMAAIQRDIETLKKT